MSPADLGECKPPGWARDYVGALELVWRRETIHVVPRFLLLIIAIPIALALTIALGMRNDNIRSLCALTLVWLLGFLVGVVADWPDDLRIISGCLIALIVAAMVFMMADLNKLKLHRSEGELAVEMAKSGEVGP